MTRVKSARGAADDTDPVIQLHDTPENLEVYGSIRNIFDRNAPFDPTTYGQQSFNPLDYAGAIGRFYSIGVKYKFF